jgi:hypothetical protein
MRSVKGVRRPGPFAAMSLQDPYHRRHLPIDESGVGQWRELHEPDPIKVGVTGVGGSLRGDPGSGHTHQSR